MIGAAACYSVVSIKQNAKEFWFREITKVCSDCSNRSCRCVCSYVFPCRDSHGRLFLQRCCVCRAIPGTLGSDAEGRGSGISFMAGDPATGWPVESADGWSMGKCATSPQG